MKRSAAIAPGPECEKLGPRATHALAMPTLTRRSVLRHLATGAGLGALGLTGCLRRDLGPLLEAIVRVTPDRAAATALGEAYLAERPRETLDSILRRLAIELDWTEASADEAVVERFIDRIERDFRDAETVRVDAWVLSQTEARWAAAVALAGREPA